MRLHFFQHEPFEKPFAIEDWARSKDAIISSTHFYRETSFPELKQIDWLVVMGGSMSVNDEEDLPWLREEKAYLKKAIESGKKVLGICLGAQMIANVLGSEVYPNKEKEIGWFPVSWKREALESSLFSHLPKQLMVMHWHGETFALPAGAVHLAESKACVNQAFIYNRNALGLQFHMEFNEQAVTEMILNCSHELVPGKYVQEVDVLLEGKKYIETASKGLTGILDAFYQS